MKFLIILCPLYFTRSLGMLSLTGDIPYISILIVFSTSDSRINSVSSLSVLYVRLGPNHILIWCNVLFNSLQYSDSVFNNDLLSELSFLEFGMLSC